MEWETLSVGELELDVQNPRHEPVTSQRDAILEIIANQRQRLVVLASDIKEHGLNPMKRMMVIEKGKRYTVVEGNRRLTAIKLLNNPDLAKDTPIAAAIKRIAKDAAPPDEVDCAIAPDRDAAAHWMELEHAGSGDGAGVVPWQTLAKHRFSEKPGSQAAKAIAFLDALESGYPENEVIQELIVVVADKRLTTLGRLVADPNFKSKFGMVEGDGGVTFKFAADDLREGMEQILGDIGSDVTVSDIRTKDQREEYLATVPSPPSSNAANDPAPLGDAPSKETTKPKKKKRKAAKKPTKPLAKLDLGALGGRVDLILGEFQSFNVDKVPNAAAFMVRAILELAVDQYIAEKGLSANGELKTRVKRVLKTIDPSYKDARYQGVRQGLQDGTSIFAISTLHGFVHNKDFHPDGSTVRSIASNLEPFLQALNDDV